MQAIDDIERLVGRVRLFRNSPRKIDIDLLFYNNMVMCNPSFTVPHPLMHKRAFVLVPLAEIAPSKIHPVLKRSVLDMLRRIGTQGVKSWR